MRCIWQMDGDKVKGFKCEFSPIDMLIILSGLRYITADLDRHPKDRERAQYMYDKIMSSRYEDKLQGDDIIVRSNLEPFRVDESQTEMPRCSVNGTPYDECGFCEYFNCDTCKCEADVPQTERSE